MAQYSLVYFNETNQASLRNEVSWLRALLKHQGHLIDDNQRAALLALLNTQKKRLNNKILISHSVEDEDDGGERIKAEIEATRRELDCYAETGLNLNLAGVLIPFPRAQYLSSRLGVLKLMHPTTMKTTKPDKAVPDTFFYKLIALIRKGFNVCKKGIDLVDDLWTAIGNTALPKALVSMVTPFIVGVASGIVHAVEGILGLKTVIKAATKIKTSIRKTKIATGSIITALAGAGVGISAAYLTTGTGIVLAGSALMPAIIPALLFAVFAVALSRNLYKLHDVKNKIDEMTQKNSKLFAEIETLQKNNQLLAKKRAVFCSINTNTSPQQIEQNALELINLFSQESVNNMKLATCRHDIENNNKTLAGLGNSLKKAEREVAFKTLELVAAAIVFIGVVLGTAAIVGAASAASFGIVPLVICIVGVTLGMGFKIFEQVDKKKDHKLSDGIIEKLKNGLSSIFSRKNSTQPAAAPCLTAKTRSSNAATYAALGNNSHNRIVVDTPVPPATYQRLPKKPVADRMPIAVGYTPGINRRY